MCDIINLPLQLILGAEDDIVSNEKNNIEENSLYVF